MQRITFPFLKTPFCSKRSCPSPVLAMSWHFLFLILAFADSASISCDQESAEDAFVQLSPAHARKRRTSESNLKIQLLGAFTGGKLCGQIVATPCTSPTLDVTDPVVSLCCEQFSFRELGDVCEDFTPGCQAQKAACEMALFLCDDANPLLQPQFFVEPGTYPWNSQLSDMGGYNLNLWQALQNLTAICFGDGYEWLRSQSNYIKTRSGNVDRACQGIGQECELDPKSADSTEEGDESMERMQHILVESGTAAGGLVILAAMDFTPAGAIASTIFKTAMGLALETTSGPPTNPCTYAGKDWGQCVWYQVRQYVERYVTSYVKEALEKYNEGQLEDRLRQIDTQVNRVKQDYRDQVRSNESLENVIEELQDLRSRLVGEAAWFLDSELLPQIFGISVTVQTLALSAGDLQTASSLMTLPASALCFAKALLKRGTYFMQNRMSELKATQVNRTSLRGDGHHWRYYYKGQFDAQCQTTEHDALKHSPYICDPGYGVSNAPHHTFPQNRQGEGECGVSQKHGHPRWKEWLCHQAYVRRVQQKIWARFVGSVVSLVELALNQSSMSKSLGFDLGAPLALLVFSLSDSCPDDEVMNVPGGDDDVRVVGEGAAPQAALAVNTGGPQHFRLDVEPVWLQGLQQETLTKRADEQEAALAQMRKEFKELERDLQVDEMQLVVGGWVEAKREHVESDVRAMFEQLNALPLLKAVFVPYVRSSFCRVELFYTDDNIWAQRKLQTMVLQHLKAMTFVSRVQSLCQKYLGDHAVDRDWRGKTGWFLNVKMLEDQDTWDQGCIAAAARQPGVSSRPASLKYQDPPEVKELIDRSTCCARDKARGLRALVTRDERNRIPEYFTRLLKREVEATSVPSVLFRVQVLDGITAAQSVMTLVRRTTGSPCKAIQLAKLCFGTSVVVGVGGVERTLELQRGIMQGSAFSADVFSRLMDWALKPQTEEMETLFPSWSESIQGIPHFLIYADDLIVFADSERALQTKVTMLIRALQRIGLEVNPAKCKVLHEPGGETCPGIWLPATACPLKGEDQLVFLGVPVGHNVGASVILSHLL
ncbi:unnamed protein product [Symbiodinium necroappetens]|uniref:Reverse transcriptase domain-containing protein n=1 Tax=Symbiodinium necroappetens TaxID=1628268 RepID=A0A812QLD4_9DINO|nr:unnamed protein product [Symbiodinium necroappetens]